MFKAPDVQIVEMVRNRREKSEDAVDIVGRFGDSEAGFVTPGRVWLLLGRTKEKKCETAIKELRLIIDLSCLYL